MRIIEFISEIKDAGAETLIKDYALLMDKSIFDVTILTVFPNSESANSKILTENNIRIISIYRRKSFFQRLLHRLCGEKYIQYRTKKIIQQLQPDCVHIHLEWLHVFSSINKSLSGIKLFYTCHNEPDHFFSGNRYHEFLAARKLIKDNHLQLIALHEKMKEELDTLFDIDNTLVLKNGINFERFISAREKSVENLRNKYDIDKDAFVLGHVGRFSYQKNHEFLIDIFAQVKKIRKNSVLFLVGEGPLENDVHEKLEKLNLIESTRILSHRSDIPDIMRTMDVFVFPSRFEGLGIVLVEAQVVGIKCVVSTEVPEAAFLSNHIFSVGLEQSAEKWSEVILNQQPENQHFFDINEYNMKYVIEKLEGFYLGETYT